MDAPDTTIKIFLYEADYNLDYTSTFGWINILNINQIRHDKYPISYADMYEVMLDGAWVTGLRMFTIRYKINGEIYHRYTNDLGYEKIMEAREAFAKYFKEEYSIDWFTFQQ